VAGSKVALSIALANPLFSLEEPHSYIFIYSGFFRHPGNAHISMISLVGAGRFERPTPCARGSSQPPRKALIFKPFCFKLMPGPY
jgi:hypothetical protein